MQSDAPSENMSDSEDLDDAYDPAQFNEAVEVFDEWFQQEDIRMPPPLINNPAGDTPYNFPKWSAMPAIKSAWEKFKTVEASRNVSRDELSEELAITQLDALLNIQQYLESTMPNGTPILDERLFAFCGSFTEVFENFCVTFDINPLFPSLKRHESASQHLPVTWKEESTRSLGSGHDGRAADRLTLPDHLSVAVSSLPTLKSLSLFIEDRPSRSDASVSHITQPGPRLSVGSASFRESAQREFRLAVRALETLLEDSAFLQHFPVDAGTLLRSAWSAFDSMERKAQRRIDQDPELSTHWKELGNRYLRSQQALEMEKLQSILRGLLPSDGTITVGPSSRLCLAYDKLAMLFATLYARDGKCSLLVFDQDRGDFTEYRDSVSWEPRTTHGSHSRETSHADSASDTTSSDISAMNSRSSSMHCSP